MIDLREFHSTIMEHVIANAMFSHRYIDENTIIALIDSIISFCLSVQRNIECNGLISQTRPLFLYYEREDFIEVYDELLLSFSDFLWSKGIIRYRNYKVIRVDNFKTFFIEYEMNEKDCNYKSIPNRKKT